ncbi:quinolinate synthase NadA [Thalassobacillus sp. C254]|uniref:quinolinate synthase NadA n=1 Tax=Thalassobacillus sp. C254 TaxID=1225341 RepID=UPI0006D00404|nr:quinolinate synthase NadA [Thalassobacillus sp. C254]
MSFLEMIEQIPRLPEHYLQMNQEELRERVMAHKKRLGQRLYIPGHHYQKDEVIEFADDTGDSLQLARLSEQNNKAEYVIFLGVHFMAETADILTSDDQKVILPDLRAGCSMADMADIDQTEKAWEKLMELFEDTIVPLTYVNSTAAIKAFCGKHGGATVTSSNAGVMFDWALSQKKRVLFLPDQHLGRNTAYDKGIPLENMAVWDPIKGSLEYEGRIEDVQVILWKGHCSVHEKFTVNQIQTLRAADPETKIIVHPECSWEVVQAADYNGSTNKIITTIEQAPAGSKWAVGTEMNLVQRLKHTHQNKEIHSLNPAMCPCLTMNRIDLPHLLWSLDSIKKNHPHHIIKVDKDTAVFAKTALERMLSFA